MRSRKPRRARARRLSGALAAGISEDMSTKGKRRSGLCGAVALAALLGGCGWRELQHDQLFGPDAAAPDADASDSGDGTMDVVAEDAIDATDTQVDLTTVETEPVVDAADASTACTPTSCGPEQFCDDLTKICAPNHGDGMLSGVVYETCQHRPVMARIGIAGLHQCAVDLKGSYFFRSGLPVGLLTLSAYAEGYKVFSVTVDVKTTGTIQDIAMMPDSPNGCADPTPAAVACTCTISGCPNIP